MGVMMKKIMLMTNPELADTVGTVPTSYYKLRKHVLSQNGINTGNKIFITAVEQYLSKENIDYWAMPYQTVCAERISEEFDMVIAPLANIFQFGFSDFLNDLASWVERLRIPFFILGCGIECRTESELSLLKEDIYDGVCRLINAVYTTGGEIATRGYYTKSFLDMCMKNTAVATGCPSLYRRGKNAFSKEKVDKNDFSVALVSADYPHNLLNDIFDKYPKSELFDQGLFINYFIKYVKEREDYRRFVYAIKKELGLEYILQFSEANVFPCIDVPSWHAQLKKHSFAYGSRIHGINAALEAGIPMKLVSNSCLRTRELAEFIGVPMSEKYENRDLYEQYLDIDIDTLNRKYNEGFDIFEKFMIDHNITDGIEDRSFWKRRNENLIEQISLWDDHDIEKVKILISNDKYNYEVFSYYKDKIKKRIALKLL